MFVLLLVVVGDLGDVGFFEFSSLSVLIETGVVGVAVCFSISVLFAGDLGDEGGASELLIDVVVMVFTVGDLGDSGSLFVLLLVTIVVLVTGDLGDSGSLMGLLLVTMLIVWIGDVGDMGGEVDGSPLFVVTTVFIVVDDGIGVGEGKLAAFLLTAMVILVVEEEVVLLLESL